MRDGFHRIHAGWIWLAVAQTALASSARAQSPQLSIPTANPLHIDFAAGPILRLADSSVPVEQFAPRSSVRSRTTPAGSKRRRAKRKPRQRSTRRVSAVIRRATPR